MALIKCPECQKEVSDKATTCIYCGYPISACSSGKSTTQTKQVPNNTTFQENNGSNKNNSGKGGCFITIVIILLIGFLLSMCSSGGSGGGDRTCAWCNGTGYSGNGAKNATEYVLMKTPCKHCGGDGNY